VNQDLDSSYSPKTSNKKPSQNSGRNEEIPEAMEEIRVGNDPMEPVCEEVVDPGHPNESTGAVLESPMETKRRWGGWK
jgi:hypothetical protein